MKTKLHYFFIFLVLFAVSLAQSRGAVVFNTLVSFTYTNAPNYGWNNGEPNDRMGALVQGDDGNFYGNTFAGGTFSDGIVNGDNTYGSGTVFKVTPDGTFTSLFSFPDYIDVHTLYLVWPYGLGPVGNLAKAADGSFYGVTYSSGGTVFQTTTNGTLNSLYQFSQGRGPSNTNTDGGLPRAGVVQGSDGNLYGTTAANGFYGQGTIFQLTTSGLLTTLHSFSALDGSGDNFDGAQPNSELVQGSDGNFYGTTRFGGTNYWGTVFKITPGGNFTTLHSFNVNGNGGDGAYPNRLLQAKDGNLYGTTELGGGTYGATGTFYQITTNGTFTVLYDFSASFNVTGEGSCVGGIIQGSDGNFYGTGTGGADNAGGAGLGTVFQLTTNGTITILYTFSGLDGSDPQSALVQGKDGSFYGTTTFGGSSYVNLGYGNSGYGLTGYGTIFRITIPPAFQSVTQTNGMFNFAWSIMPGQKYQLQSNTNMSSTNWLNLGSSATASTTTVSASDSMTNSQCFYRIMLSQ